MRPLRVYVAGSSDPQENARVAVAMMTVKSHPNMELVYDWPEVIAAHGGKANAGLSKRQREDASDAAIMAVLEADILWFLAPNFQTRGAWVELGVGITRFKQGEEIGLISSGNTQQSIFCAWTQEFKTDADAIFELSKMADAFVKGQL